jgi:hypothetical protein
MSDDLIDRLHNPHFNDLQWPKGLFAECADRIEALEAALRLYAGFESNGIQWMPIDDKGAVARAALAGEKKDD